jgi:hypothetical protein
MVLFHNHPILSVYGVLVDSLGTSGVKARPREHAGRCRKLRCELHKMRKLRRWYSIQIWSRALGRNFVLNRLRGRLGGGL